MLINYYKLKIEGKDVKRFIKSLIRINIYFEEIHFNEDSCYIKVDYKNYLRLIEIKTSYEIKIVKLYGLNNILKNIKNNMVLFTIIIIGVFFLYFLSTIIFDIEVVHNDKKIRNLITNELKKNNIKKYSFVKSYSTQTKIKMEILNNNKEKLEWLEIERIGTKYVIRVEERIKNNIPKKDKPKHIVAKKTGIIIKIDANSGEIQKKINDYVKQGDIIISGAIHRNDKAVDNISAAGAVYAEVWYKVKVELPLSYKEETKTGKSKKIMNITFLNNEANLFDFDKYKNSIVEKKTLFSDFFGLFSINIAKHEEVIIKDEVNTINSEALAIKLAEEKINANLKSGEYIISRKKLKTSLKDSTMSIEIFFKVCENISEAKYYEVNDIEE